MEDALRNDTDWREDTHKQPRGQKCKEYTILNEYLLYSHTRIVYITLARQPLQGAVADSVVNSNRLAVVVVYNNKDLKRVNCCPFQVASYQNYRVGFDTANMAI